jgi:hypothetical protein
MDGIVIQGRDYASMGENETCHNGLAMCRKGNMFRLMTVH